MVGRLMPKVGLSIPVGAPGRSTVEFAQRAEAAGAHSVWATDRIVDSTPDIFVTLGIVAAVTSQVLIGSSIALGVLRPPILLAKAATSIDVVSNGRLILGMGVGSRAEDFLATEIPISQRGRRMEEAVAICKLAWSGQPVKFQGRYHAIDIGPMRERPVQLPHPPLWFGGQADAVLRRTAREGQGFIASTSSGVDGFRRQWHALERYAADAGRDARTQITPAALAYASVAENRVEAERAMRDHLVRSYGPVRLERGLGPLVGTPDDVVRGAHEYFAAGVEVLIISSVSAGSRHLELLCERVIARIGAD